MTCVPHINRIGTAVPANDVHDAFVHWAEGQITEPQPARLFQRMAERSGIRHRWSVLTAADIDPATAGGFYSGRMPPTSARMALYAQAAPDLALTAIAALGPLDAVTHLVVASCTGFVAPGIDQIIARRLGLDGSVERTLVGFMGCYAAIAALGTAFHIVRSVPDARVLVVTVELSTLHLQATQDIESLLAMLQFGDGAAAAIVSADPVGLAIDRRFAATLEDSHELIQWRIGDEGFVMQLSGAVPGRIATALERPAVKNRIATGPVDGWAVHAGGRSVLDAVIRGLGLPANALDHSRAVLDANGNMSSATLMFVLARFLAGPPIENGVALAFGPGLAVEGLGFRSA